MASMLLGEELTPSLTPTLQRAAVGAPATLEVVARNALASVYAVRLPAGCVGVDIKFRNEACEPCRIEVAACRGAPAAAGVRVGDVVVSFGGQALPRRTSAVELEDLVSLDDDARRAFPIDVVIWRNEANFCFGDDGDGGGDGGDGDWRGDEVVVDFDAGRGGRRASSVAFASVPGAGPGGAPLLVAARTAHAARGVAQAGLVVLAVNHEPVPDGLAPADFRARLDHYERIGPVSLNLLRLANRRTRAALLRYVGADARGRRHAATTAPSWVAAFLCDLAASCAPAALLCAPPVPP